MTRLSNQEGLAEWLPRSLAEEHPVVTVIGDAILDGWWDGLIERFCREAPAPVVEIGHRDFAPGGAANTAMNLAALGADVRLVSIIGEDTAGRELTARLAAAGVDTRYLVTHADMVTTTKYRISSGGQLLLRLDDAASEIPAGALDELGAMVPGAVATSDAVVLCDYAAGALDGEVRARLLETLAERDGMLLVVDAHDPARWSQLRPDLATPNAREAAQLLGTKWPSGPERSSAVESRGTELLDASGAVAVVVTLDRDGTITLTAADGTHQAEHRASGSSQAVATHRAVVVHRTWARPEVEKQASGAGDTFVAALTMARVVGLPLTTSLDLAQAAADVVVHRPGTSVCSTEELCRHIAQFAETALLAGELEQQIEAHRRDGHRIVLTNGCFDVLHRGHTRYLNQAKQLGDVLIVAINSDASVRELKGPDRPVNPEADRAAVIAALSCVDYVTVFDTPTPIPLIDLLQPDVYAKGGDYTPEMLAETKAVERYGGTVAILDYVPEHSTTAVLERIRTAGEGSGTADGEGEVAVVDG